MATEAGDLTGLVNLKELSINIDSTLPTGIFAGTKPIPRWDVHFGGLEDDLKDSTALHLTFTSQPGATDSAV